jgi:hypothetical protein
MAGAKDPGGDGAEEFMKAENDTTREALAIAISEVLRRYNFISQRQWPDRDLTEERMLLIAGAILYKIKGAKDPGGKISINNNTIKPRQ